LTAWLKESSSPPARTRVGVLCGARLQQGRRTHRQLV
jgi:hypothetical protein